MTTRRDLLKAIPTVGTAFAISSTVMMGDAVAHTQTAPPLDGHFHPKGKAPSKHTLDILSKAQKTLPFHDTQDFDEQKRGLIAELPHPKIMADAGHVAWDKERFEFLNTDEQFDSIHPPMQRISTLNQNYGLYEVVPGIYQVHGFDLSDISFVRGKTGWIVIDPLVSAEPARAAVCLSQQLFIPTPTATTGVVCVALSMKKMCARVKLKLLRPLGSLKTISKRSKLMALRWCSKTHWAPRHRRI